MSRMGSLVYEFDLVEHRVQELSIDQLKIDFEQTQKVYWVHCDLNQPEDLGVMISQLQLPEHIVEWYTHPDKTPKFMDDDASIALQVESLLPPHSYQVETELDFASLIIYLTPQFCFTASWEPIPALYSLKSRSPKAVNYAKTSCFMLFLLLDGIINDYSRTLLDFQSISDQFDLKVREKFKNIYAEVMTVKKQVMKARAYISAIRDTLMRVSAKKMAVISKECRISLKNLLNHSQILFVQFDSVRDVLNSTLSQVDNTLMQEMNSTIRILTAFAAIFMPMSLIASIYGMNFAIPQYEWKSGYIWALGFIGACGIILFWIFKKKRLF